jgi:hypothetical protein
MTPLIVTVFMNSARKNSAKRNNEYLYGDDEQGRLDREPPEALAVRMQQGHAVRLDQRPCETSDDGDRAERRDGARSDGSGSGYFEFADEFGVHSLLPGSWERSGGVPAALGLGAC